MTQLSQVITLKTASENEVTLDVTKLSTATMSRSGDQHCIVTYCYKHGQGERNFRLHASVAQSLQGWLNAHSATLQADHSTGVSVWIAKAQEGKGPNIGNMIEAILGQKSPGEAQVEHQLMTLFATAREVKFSDDFIMDFTPMILLVMKTVARAAALEEIARFKNKHPSLFQKDASAPALPPEVHALLLDLTTHGRDFLDALGARVTIAVGEDVAAQKDAEHPLSPQERDANESYWRKQVACMERLIATSRDALTKYHPQVPL